MRYDFKSIPLPPKIAELQRDKRGYPIPFIVLRDTQDTPHFQINDDRKVEQALAENLCAICGQYLPEDDVWLVGGPQSAFNKHGAYIDTPTHYECLEYALKVCPHLAISKHQYKRDLSDQLNAVDFGQQTAIAIDPTQDPNKVPLFVAIRISGYRIVRNPDGSRYVVPNRPYKKIEFWNDGEQLSSSEAQAVMDNHNHR